MRRALVIIAALLIVLSMTAGVSAWKWSAHHHSRAIAGWTWDGATQSYVETQDDGV